MKTILIAGLQLVIALTIQSSNGSALRYLQEVPASTPMAEIVPVASSAGSMSGSAATSSPPMAEAAPVASLTGSMSDSTAAPTSPPPAPDMAPLAAPLLPTSSCMKEDGVDYIDNDLMNKPGQYGDCCGYCWATNGCKAWSWTKYNGGTCWLKTARGNTQANPNVRSGWLDNKPQCPIQDNLDYIGNDIGRSSSATAGGCCQICRQYPGCNAFSWSNYNGGTCWLKSAKDQTFWNPNVKSGQINSNPPPSCKLQYNTDYVDNDIGNTKASKPEDCCSICKLWSGCKAFSWSNYNGGTCWLKSKKGATVTKQNVVSSVVFPSTCNIQYGIDYIDNDIGNAPSPDVHGCCDICASYNGCKAFSWSKYNGGTCWLKSAKGATVNNPNVNSGTI